MQLALLQSPDELDTDTKFVLLHEGKNDEGIKSFFGDVWELYVKVRCALSDYQSS